MKRGGCIVALVMVAAGLLIFPLSGVAQMYRMTAGELEAVEAKGRVSPTLHENGIITVMEAMSDYTVGLGSGTPGSIDLRDLSINGLMENFANPFTMLGLAANSGLELNIEMREINIFIPHAEFELRPFGAVSMGGTFIPESIRGISLGTLSVSNAAFEMSGAIQISIH